MKVLVTGGLGFKGSVLIPKLLTRGHEVLNLDINWFGNNLAPNENYNLLEKSLMNVCETDPKGVEAVIHLHLSLMIHPVILILL